MKRNETRLPVDAPTEAPRLWPRLGFVNVGPLDYLVPQYDVAWLTHNAHQLQTDPRRPTDWNIGQFLRQIAETPAAIKELNRCLERAPESIRALNIAVHFRAKRESGETFKKALYQVALTWNCAEGTVKAADRDHGRAARSELDALVQLVEKSRGSQRLAILAMLWDDMADRAKLSWFAARKPATKKQVKNRRRK